MVWLASQIIKILSSHPTHIHCHHFPWWAGVPLCSGFRQSQSTPLSGTSMREVHLHASMCSSISPCGCKQVCAVIPQNRCSLGLAGEKMVEMHLIQEITCLYALTQYSFLPVCFTDMITEIQHQLLSRFLCYTTGRQTNE